MSYLKRGNPLDWERVMYFAVGLSNPAAAFHEGPDGTRQNFALIGTEGLRVLK